ncbi:MAG: L-lysine 6-transaminase [Acidobacteriota bacterium]
MVPADVMKTLQRFMLVDGFDLVIDFEHSAGSRIVDARSGRSYLDMFTMFASHPLGMNHPRLTEPEFVSRIGRAAVNKPSNSDIYTVEMAEFVDVFGRVAAPGWMRHLFLVSGGALAVENALKVAFDWKVRKNEAAGRGAGLGGQVVHFRQAFHGRSGYTMSLTNTDPTKTLNFPKFTWPRIDNPVVTFPCSGDRLDAVVAAEERAVDQIEQVVSEHGHDIAALIVEPIQGEGGDNHFRGEFLKTLRRLCDTHEIFFILDEVQTGLGMTGRWWAHQHVDVEPVAHAFGQKTQVCGIAVGGRVDEVADHCFAMSSRINSTWGGNLTDMVRATRFIEIISDEHLVDNAASAGAHGLARLEAFQADHPEEITNARGRGLFLAFDLVRPEIRPALLARAFDDGLIVLGSGERSVRLRPALNVTPGELDEAAERLDRALAATLDGDAVSKVGAPA